MKNNMSTVKKGVMNTVKNIATRAAVKSANSACVWWHYQPKQTDAIKELRKF